MLCTCSVGAYHLQAGVMTVVAGYFTDSKLHHQLVQLSFVCPCRCHHTCVETSAFLHIHIFVHALNLVLFAHTAQHQHVLAGHAS